MHNDRFLRTLPISLVAAALVSACAVRPTPPPEPEAAPEVAVADAAGPAGEHAPGSRRSGATRFDGGSGAAAPRPPVGPAPPDPRPAETVTAPPLPAHMLARLQAGLVLDAGYQDRRIDDQLAWYARNQAYMQRVFDRSAPFLHYILGELDRRDMPADIALLPIVESAYDPFAYSHGRAAGMWQMIPGTARRFGVKQNWWYDGRRDILDSTRAALDYLEYLRDEFDGDWLLAIAGYNSGEGNVHRAIRRNLARGEPTDFWHLDLPRETSNYVPRLLALSRLMADPGRYELTLPELDDVPGFEVVDLAGQMDIALLADLAGLDVEQVYALNPGFNRWATDPDGPHRVLLPVAAAPPASAALAELPASARVNWVRYRIKPGDALLTIARRHHTTVEVLREVNGIRGNTIRAGDYLMIPTATAALGHYTLSAGNRLAALQGTPRGQSRIDYRVRAGDSLWSISRAHGIGLRELAKWNGMAPGDTLAAGRELVIWTDGPVAARAGGATLTPGDRTRKIRYTVRRGDSLFAISQKFRVSVNDLKRWNALDGNKYLQPGQKLVMYVDVTRQSGG